MKKSISFIIAIAAMVCLATSALADNVCVGIYTWTIPTGDTEWNGKDEGKLFGLFEGTATWTVQNDKSSPSVNAELMKVVKWLPDKEVARMSTITSSQSKDFVAGDDAGYYAVITASNDRGTTGKTWVDQDSSIAG